MAKPEECIPAGILRLREVGEELRQRLKHGKERRIKNSIGKKL